MSREERPDDGLAARLRTAKADFKRGFRLGKQALDDPADPRVIRKVLRDGLFVAAATGLVAVIVVVGRDWLASDDDLRLRAPTTASPTITADAPYRVAVFGDAAYELRVLRNAWVRVGPSFSPAERQAGSAVSTTRTHQLRAFPPRVALSLGGSSRRLLIREGICPSARTEGQLLRCLRAASAP
ncbi:MAG: hypothetical protein ICV59_00300 [Thermoleophilia bacterium]|nr:hypothetical protein [Thermoleophilia bacterium]